MTSLAAALLYLSGCGAADDSSTVDTLSDSSIAATDSGEVLAVSSVSALLGGADGAKAPGSLPTAKTAGDPCPTLNDAALSGCANGGLTLVYDKCQFTGSSGGALWSGGAQYQFLGADGSAVCPGSVAVMKSFGDTVTKTFIGNTRRVSTDTTVTIDTATASGYDTTVIPRPLGGTATRYLPGGREIRMQGIHYTALRKSARHKHSEPVWDHTVSTADVMKLTEADGTRQLDGTVVVQQNIARYTTRVEFQGVKYEPARCGCQPFSGSITANFSGQKTGSVTITLTDCGKGTFVDSTGASGPTVLNHCL